MHAEKKDGTASEMLVYEVDDMVCAQETPKAIDVESGPHTVHSTVDVLAKNGHDRVAKPKRILDLERREWSIISGWIISRGMRRLGACLAGTYCEGLKLVH